MLTGFLREKHLSTLLRLTGRRGDGAGLRRLLFELGGNLSSLLTSKKRYYVPRFPTSKKRYCVPRFPWGAIDGSWFYGGKATIDGVPGKRLNNLGVGLTLGYQINDNLNLTLGYKTTVDDSAPTDLRMDCFMVTLVYGWHPLVEGMKRLQGEK